MGVSTSIGILSQILDRYESDGGQVHQVDVTIPGRDEGDERSILVDIAVPLCSVAAEQAETEQTMSLRDDGGLRIELSPSIVPAIDEYTPKNVSSTTEAARITGDGTILVTVSLNFTTDEKSDTAETPHPSSPDSDTESDSLADSTTELTNSAQVASVSSETTAEPPTPVDEPIPIPTSEDRSTRDPTPESETDCESSLDAEIKRALELARNDDLPPYEDIEYLQCLYDSFNTFEPMADALEMDVASETVRRYMIDAEIHEPAAYDTSAEGGEDEQVTDADPVVTNGDTDDGEMVEQEHSEHPSKGTITESEPGPDRSAEMDDSVESSSDKQLVTDGVGLPDDVAGPELIDAVQSSMTLYDVDRQLNLGRNRTRELLAKLNLLDFVVKRVYDSDDLERRPSQDEIADRIRESVAH